MISPSQRPLPDNTQHSQQTNIHAPGGIRTHNLSRRAAVDLRLRPRGHWVGFLVFYYWLLVNTTNGSVWALHFIAIACPSHLLGKTKPGPPPDRTTTEIRSISVASLVDATRCALGPVWKGAENLTLTGVQTPNSPARSELLYRLRYPSCQMSVIV